MGLRKSNILCSSPEKSFLKYIAGVISSVICCLLFRVFLQESSRDGDPPAASPPVYLKKEISISL